MGNGRRAVGTISVAAATYIFRREDAAFQDPGQNALPGGSGTGRIAVRPTAFRRLRQGDKEGRFGRVQAARLLAEIRQACGAHALDIAAVGSENKI
jgi:hypothetical protein